jgi:hypothetical protein
MKKLLVIITVLGLVLTFDACTGNAQSDEQQGPPGLQKKGGVPPGLQKKGGVLQARPRKPTKPRKARREPTKRKQRRPPSRDRANRHRATPSKPVVLEPASSIVKPPLLEPSRSFTDPLLGTSGAQSTKLDPIDSTAAGPAGSPATPRAEKRSAPGSKPSVTAATANGELKTLPAREVPATLDYISITAASPGNTLS